MVRIRAVFKIMVRIRSVFKIRIRIMVWVRVRVRIKVLFRVRVSFPLSALEGMGSPQKLFVDSQMKSLKFRL